MWHLELIGKAREKGVKDVNVSAPWCQIAGRWINVKIADEALRCCYHDEQRAVGAAGVATSAVADNAERVGFEDAHTQLVVRAKKGVCPVCGGRS